VGWARRKKQGCAAEQERPEQKRQGGKRDRTIIMASKVELRKQLGIGKDEQ